MKLSELFNFFIIINITIKSCSTKIHIYKKRELYTVNEITIKIIGNGTQKILYPFFRDKPNEILVNGIPYPLGPNNTITDLENEENNITMKWNYNLKDCKEMFSDLDNLVDIDLTYFDSSEVTSMLLMFYDCKNLKSFKAEEIITSSVNDLGSMFYNCQSLTSLDLTSFDTSNVINLSSMFFNCKSLEYLDISSFDVSQVTSLGYLFTNCLSLTSLDLSNFNTINVKSMVSMFSHCSSLISLNLSNFETSLVERANSMFLNCTKLKYLDISNFNATLFNEISFFLSNCEELEYINLKNIITGINTNINVMAEGISSDLTFCSKNENFSHIFIEKLNNKGCIMNDCLNDWKIKQKKLIGDKNICVYNCSEYEAYYQFQNKCYSECPKGTYSSSKNKYICKIQCQKDFPFEKNEKCFSNCSAKEFLDNECLINYKSIDSKQYIINTIENAIIKGYLDSLITIINNEKQDIFINDSNKEIYTITSTYNQKNYNYDNGETIINICECENILKRQYNIDNNKNLIIYKMEYYFDSFLIPIIEYEIFHPETKEKLNLEYCIDEMIQINIFVEILEENLYKYNPFSDYYKSECYPDNSTCGDENILIERIDEFNKNNLSLCENNCKYKSYNSNNQRVICECKIKTNFSPLSEILNSQNKLLFKIENLPSKTDIITNNNINIISSISQINDYSESYLEEKDCFFVEKESKDCNNTIEFKDLIEKKYFPRKKKFAIDKVFELYSTEFKNKNIDKEQIIEGEDIIFQMTTTERQNYYYQNSLYNNISSINLSECEKTLQNKWGIKEPLIIYKIDIKENNSVSTQVEYEIYNPISLEKLNLSDCNQIEIYTPIHLDEDTYNLVNNLKAQGYDFFNSNDDFYNDICSSYTSLHNTDVTLNDRKNDFYNSNISLCEENCEYKNYNTESLKAKCVCNIKNEIKSELNSKFFPNIIVEHFYKVEKYTNIRVFICSKKIFDFKKLKKNYGNYIILFIGLIFFILMISVFLTIKKKLRNIMEIIFYKYRTVLEQFNSKEISKGKKIEDKNNKKGKPKIKSINRKSKKNEKEKNKKVLNQLSSNLYYLINNPKKKNNNKINKYKIKNKGKNSFRNKEKILSNNFNKNLSSYNSQSINKKESGMNIININGIFISSNKMSNFNINSKIEKNNIKDNNNKNEIIEKIINFVPEKKRYTFFVDDELNSLEYKYAIKIDFRSFWEFYLSLLKQTNLIIFTFFVYNDYNIFLLKLSLFLLSFALFFFMNALFFSDDSMHQIYKDEGDYDIIYQFPQMLYSTIVSQIISSLLEILSLSQDEVLSLKEKGDIVNIKKEIKKINKYIKIKCSIFFLIGIILLFLFWYYLTAFCTVYYNTQIPLIKNTFISFITSMIYPLIFNLIPAIFRIIGLRYKIKCHYVFSKIITKIIELL